ncbi:MAG: hypothetical protein EOP47_07125 [Sphingobacteriaceae bacterium]|nr:MAG: hypothetical protein EOP47_07125 [Sphingobacteriaceae bacterium]
MRFNLSLLTIAALLCCFTACKKEDPKEPVPDTIVTVNINGKEYKTVKIGTQTWIAENYTGDGGMAYGPNAKPEYGKYYTYTEVQAIALPAGWRLPTADDFKTLGQANGIVFTQGAQNTEAAKKLISKTGWKNATGNNASGFNLLPANMIFNGQPTPDGDVAEVWVADGTTFSIMEASTNGSLLNVQFFSNSYLPEYRFPVRFVKN